MKLKLLGSKVCILISEQGKETKTKAGIIVPVEKKEQNRGIVLQKGLKCSDPNVKEGDVVLVLEYQGTTIDYEGVKYQLFEEDSILAVITEEDENISN